MTRAGQPQPRRLRERSSADGTVYMQRFQGRWGGIGAPRYKLLSTPSSPSSGRVPCDACPVPVLSCMAARLSVPKALIWLLLSPESFPVPGIYRCFPVFVQVLAVNLPPKLPTGRPFRWNDYQHIGIGHSGDAARIQSPDVFEPIAGR